MGCRKPTKKQLIRKEISKGLTIIVGNLDKNAEEERIYEKFSPCGDIADIVIPRKRTNSTGISFVTFHSRDSVASALALDGTLLGCRHLRVSKAVRKVKKSKQNKSGSGKTGFREKKE